MSADRVKWEHIHRVFELCNRNVSETARRLKMHRRTLQRILSKRSLDNQILNFINLQTIVSIIILKTSAGKNGYTPRVKTLSQPVKFDNQIAPNR